MTLFMCLVSLPIDLACRIVGEWLDVKSVVALDSAYCDSTKRSVLLETVFKSPQCILQTDGSCFFDPKFFTWLCSRRIRVRSLVLDDSGSVSIIDKCNEYLQVHGRCVKAIHLRRDGLRKDKFDEFAQSIVNNCSHLTTLTLRRMFITGKVCEILENCQQLKDLRITQCSYDYDTLSAMDYLGDRNLLNIRSLELSYCSSEKTEGGVLLQTVCQFINATSLEQLETDVTEDIHLFQAFTNLKILDLSSAHCCPDGDLIAILSACPLIIDLNVSYCQDITDTSGIVIARDLHGLKSLKMHQCHFSDVALQELAVRRADTLETLCMFRNDNITAVGLAVLLDKCRSLQHLELSMADLSRFIEYPLANRRRMPTWNFEASLFGKITSLRLHCYDKYASIIFHDIVRNAHQLVHLDLFNSTPNTLDFRLLIPSVPNLRTLVLSEALFDIEKKPNSTVQDRQLRKLHLSRPEILILHKTVSW